MSYFTCCGPIRLCFLTDHRTFWSGWCPSCAGWSGTGQTPTGTCVRSTSYLLLLTSWWSDFTAKNLINTNFLKKYSSDKFVKCLLFYIDAADASRLRLLGPAAAPEGGLPLPAPISGEGDGVKDGPGVGVSDIDLFGVVGNGGVIVALTASASVSKGVVGGGRVCMFGVGWGNRRAEASEKLSTEKSTLPLSS